MNSQPKSRGPWRFAGLIVALILIALVIRELTRDWSQVRTFHWQWRWYGIVGSLVAMQMAYMTLARTWRSVLRAIGVRLRYRTAYWIFYISNLGRYIPGKIWQLGAAAMFGKRMGLSGMDMAASMIVHMLYFIPMGAAIILTTGRFPAPFDDGRILVVAWVLAAVAAFAAVWPHLILGWLRPLAAKVNIVPERWRIELSRRIAIAVQTGFAWVCLSVGFALFVMSVTPVDSAHFFDLCRVYIASHIIGYVVLIAPGGLGVRESVIAVLLEPLTGGGPAAALALLARAWATGSEVIAVLPALWLLRNDQPRSAPDSDPAVADGQDS